MSWDWGSIFWYLVLDEDFLQHRIHVLNSDGTRSPSVQEDQGVGVGNLLCFENSGSNVQKLWVQFDVSELFGFFLGDPKKFFV
jgi:hypothetical protein